MQRSTRFASALIAALLLSPLAGAQRSSREVRLDIEFARGLAADWQFVGLAEEVISELEDEGLSSEMTIELALVKCDLYADAARRGKREDRLVLYAKAIDAYKSFIDDQPFADSIEAAQRRYVDLSTNYGQYLATDLAEAVGEEADALREQISDLLVDAVTLTQELINNLETIDEPTNVEQRELYTLMLNRGLILRLLGEVSEDGTFYLEQALSTLENLAGRAGEDSTHGLRAYMELGRVLVAKEDPCQAVDFFAFVVDRIMPRDADNWEKVKEIASQAELDQRWLYVEMVIADLIEAASNCPDLGAGEAVGWGLHFYNMRQREGFELNALGFLGFLSLARAMDEAGGWVGGRAADGALEWYGTLEEASDAGHSKRNRNAAMDFSLVVAQDVNRGNKGNVLQVRAQKLISEIISRPGVEVAPDVLFEAAEGEYFNQNYRAAADAFKRVMGALETADEGTRIELGAKVMNRLGRTYEKLDRDLEAAMAFREGATRWTGDPALDPDNATKHLSALKRARGSSTDPAFAAAIAEAEGLVVRLASEDADEILFNQAKGLWDKRDHEAARTKFKSVGGAAKSYEKAIVYAAVCLIKLEQSDAAVRELEAYLNDFVTDTANDVSQNEVKRARRAEAMGMATFYLGNVAAKAKDHERVIEVLASYGSDFPDQTGYGANALYYVLLAHLAKLDYEAAKAVHAEMVERFPASKATGSGALKIYAVYSTEQKAAEERGDEEGEHTALAGRATYLNISNQLSASPSFSNLRQEGLLWTALEDWEQAEAATRRTVETYGDSTDADVQTKLRTSVKPALARSLLQQRRVQDAVDVFREFVSDDPKDKDPKKRASAETIGDYCRALAGWVEGEGREVIEVPGVGGAENMAIANAWWKKLMAVEGGRADEGRGKWEAPWYELRFMYAYTLYKWGQIDSKKLELARAQQRELRQFLESDDFEPVREACDGDDTLQRRFKWLDRELR